MIGSKGLTTNRSQSIDIAYPTGGNNKYASTVNSTANFEEGLKVLEENIINKDRGGKPIVVGVHYDKYKEGRKVINNGNKATQHFIVIVGKGYDKTKQKYFFRYYDPGTSNEVNATSDSESTRLYIDLNKKEIKGKCVFNTNRIYTITEVRKNL